MKPVLNLSALLVILFIALVSGQILGTGNLNSGSNLNSSNRARVCLLRRCNINSTVNVCGRLGRSNLCQRFANNCRLSYDSCVNSVNYTTVALSLCSGIAVGSRRTCVGSSSSTLSSSGSSNVVPIYINNRRRG